MTTLQIELPEATAQAARMQGLLTPVVLDRIFTQALRRKAAADELLDIASQVADAGLQPMSTLEIASEIKASRTHKP